MTLKASLFGILLKPLATIKQPFYFIIYLSIYFTIYSNGGMGLVLLLVNLCIHGNVFRCVLFSSISSPASHGFILRMQFLIFYWLQFQILRRWESIPSVFQQVRETHRQRCGVGLQLDAADTVKRAGRTVFFLSSLLLGAAVIAAYSWKFERLRPSISSCKQWNPPALLCMSSQRSSRVRIVNTLPCGFYIGLPRVCACACVMVSAGPLALIIHRSLLAPRQT